MLQNMLRTWLWYMALGVCNRGSRGAQWHTAWNALFHTSSATLYDLISDTLLVAQLIALLGMLLVVPSMSPLAYDWRRYLEQYMSGAMSSI